MNARILRFALFHAGACLRLCGFAAVMGSALPAAAGFSGGDGLGGGPNKWEPLFDAADKGRFAFQNSRLEYLATNKGALKHRAILGWRPNFGSTREDWFIQVDVHLKRMRLSNSRVNLSLGVLNSRNHNQGYMISIDRGTSIEEAGGFKFSDIRGKATQYSLNTAENGSLRLHFDSKAGTLCGSWRSAYGWAYFRPVKISRWGMGPDDTFTAILVGAGSTDRVGSSFSGSGEVHTVKSGDAYFRSFTCGPALPEMVVEQPAFSRLTEGVTTIRFGTAETRGSGSTRTFTIRNQGTTTLEPLSVRKGGLHGQDFFPSQPVLRALAPGEATTFNVRFRPATAGYRKGALHVRSNDPDTGRFKIHLAGMGVTGKSNERTR
jgi:hypothetical protein